MKTLLTAIVLICCLNIYGQKFKCNRFYFEITNHECDKLTFQDSLYKISFHPDSKMMKVTVYNKTNENTHILWDDCCFIIKEKVSPIVFNTTIKFKQDDAKGKSFILSQSMIEKTVAPSINWKSDMMYPLYRRNIIRKNGEDNFTFNLCLEQDNTKINYRFDFKITPIKKK